MAMTEERRAEITEHIAKIEQRRKADQWGHIQKILFKKFQEQYYDIRDFINRTGCPVNHETVRICIYKSHPVSHHILLIIAKYLSFSPAQIKEILKMSGDKEIHPLIGTEKRETPEWERGLIRAVTAIRDKDPSKLNVIADQIDLVGKAIGIDVQAHTKKLRIYPKTMRSTVTKRKK